MSFLPGNSHMDLKQDKKMYIIPAILQPVFTIKPE